MWNLEQIKIKNFFSHIDSEYKFKNGTCTLIVGENRDTGGNNGAGKTTLFEAIAIALTNKSLRDLRKESFINRESESCQITLDLYNDVSKDTLTIKRQFFRGNKSARVELIENGEINTHIVSVADADKRIIELIGISREDLLRYFIISQDNNYTFFTAGDTEKKEILNRITSADIINPILEKLSNDKKEKETDKHRAENEALSIQSKIEALEEQLQELLVANDNTNEIKQYEARIKDYKIQIDGVNEQLSQLQVKRNKQQAEYDRVIVPDSNELKKKRKELTQQFDELEERVKDNKRIIRMAESDLDGEVTCPDCGKVFLNESQLELSVEQTRQVKEDAEKENERIKKEIDEINKKISKINSDLRDIQDSEDRRETIRRGIRRTDTEISTLRDDIATFSRKIKKCEGEIEKLREQRQDNAAITSIREKIAEHRKVLSQSRKNIEAIETELELILFWNFYMGKSGFTTYLANKAVSILEGTVNSFLRKFRSNLSVNINGFKVLRDGSVREKIEVFALEDGMNAEAFMSKSGGERGRISLAGVLAINHLINLSTDGKGLNGIFLDESFAGIDSEGQSAIIRILENLGITVLMITQNVSSEFSNENRLVVVKENGVSSYI